MVRYPHLLHRVKVGDLIGMYVDLGNSEVGSRYWMQTKCEFQGLITKEIDSNYCNVMWINIKNRNGSEKLERKTIGMEEQNNILVGQIFHPIYMPIRFPEKFQKVN